MDPKQKKSAFALKALPAAVLLAATFGNATAGEVHGYFRAGAGTNSKDGAQACFGLEGISKYRLGNECDFYGEVGYTQELAKAANGVSFAGTVMGNIYSPYSDTGNRDVSINQMYVEAKGIDFLGGGSAWVGKRFYNRPDIHIIDFKYLHGDGIGGGVQGIQFGPGKFSYGLFRNDIDNRDTSATRHSFTYEGIPVNPGGGLKLDLSLINKDSSKPGANNGWSVSAVHSQDKVFGGNNTLAVQYGVGPGTFIGGTGDITASSDVKRVRVFDNIYWQPTPEFGGSFLALVQRDRTPVGTQTWYSIGARPVYAFNDIFKLQFELGHDRIKPATGGQTQQLTKFTIAPTLAAAKGFWSRPELRVFATYAKWNRAAQLAATPGSALSSTGVFGTSTNGLSAGVQVETWW